MATFDVLAWREAQRAGDIAPTHVVPPIETGVCWTRTSILDGAESRYGERSGLLPYAPCSVPCSLGEGFPEKYVKKPGNASTPVDAVLRAMKAANVSFWDHSIITFRNNLNKICNTMIDDKKEWAIDGCVLQEHPETAFLDIHHTEETMYADLDRYCYYGYKFETLCTGGGSGATVDATSEFAMVVQTKLNDLKCAIAAEVDCYDPKKATSPETASLASLVELKTARSKDSERQQKNAQRFKYPKWWVQSFIAGVPRIVVGYWTENGTLTSIESFATHELPSRALDGFRGYMRNQVWTPDCLVGFLHGVLEWMYNFLRQNNGQQYRFRYRPEQKLIMAESCTEGGDLSRRIRSVMNG